MNEVSAAELQQQIRTRIENIGKFVERNVCDNMKQFIFGGTKVARYVKRTSDYPAYINNILSLAFIFSYGCLRVDNDSDDPVQIKATRQGSLRIINSLRKAYVQYPVTSELVQFVLSDIQFEMAQGSNGGLGEVFSHLCDFHSEKFSLTKYYKLISAWKAAPSRFNMDRIELLTMFQTLLKKMVFLRDYELVQESDGYYCFKEKEAMEFGEYGKYSEIPVQHLLYYDRSRDLDMYALYSVEKLEDEDGRRRLGVRYVSCDGFKTVVFSVGEQPPANEAELPFYIESPAGHFLYQITGADWDPEDGEEETSKKNSNFIDQVHAINYKYIKNLALAISDAIGVNWGSKTALFRHYQFRHRDLFGKITSAEDIETAPLDWDGIVVMLLIESSPTSVLEILFRAVRQTFISVAQNLCNRIDNPDMPIYGLNETALNQKVDELIRNKLIVGESGGFGKMLHARSDDRLFARAASLLIVSSLSFVLEEETVEKSICAGNIYENITLLKKMRSEEPSEQNARYVCTILSETFRHLLCFYRGLLEYGEIKGRFDAESCNSCFSEQKIAVYQKQMQRAFMEAAKSEADRLKEFNAAEPKDCVALLNRFIDLCEECSSVNRASTASGSKLYAALGKHEILNVGEFKSYAQGFAHSVAGIDESNLDAWISFALDVLRYLRTGGFHRTADVPSQAIYPFSATYNRGNENYDGYKTVTFKLNIDIDGDDRVENKEYINVLTEFSYNLSDVFYCLPNVLRSNRKWWIDPVLIGFKEFNEIFVEAE